MENLKLQTLSVNAIRATCIDTINKAKSGHPGMALGSAPIAYVLFHNHITSDPSNPNWINRDRFVLSAGHASALLYTTLHISGYNITIDDLKSFRQLDSLTPGHPEYKHTPGVDATSGPLGQGIAQAVGLAMAERAVQGQYSDGEKLINHYTYCLCGDGCLQEGLSQEAISLAGHHKLNKLILIYDANQITLDGSLDLSFSENVKMRFIASGWDVLEVEDGNNIDSIDKNITLAKQSTDKPTIIIVKTIIGYGSAKQGTSSVHGSPLGEQDGALAKESYGYNYPSFTIPAEVYESFKMSFAKRGEVAHKEWCDSLKAYEISNPKEASILKDAMEENISKYVDNAIVDFNNSDSTRVASGKILNHLHSLVPFIMGGSADVAGSVMTKISDGSNFTKENPSGRNINFGIREFAMACAQNGMLLHGGLKTYVGSFLVFSDYMKSAVRTSSLSKLPAIYLFSHDSIALGEDGPTHQPIEHLAMLRSIPNLNVIRPCDTKETLGAWKEALKSKETPTALILSRQNLPMLEGSDQAKVSLGGYIVSKGFKKEADAIIIATGSEVSLAIESKEMLSKEGFSIDVVSMPCIELFEKQDISYKNSVLYLPKSKTFSVEMLTTFGWHKYADHCMGFDSFGASAPAKDTIAKFDFTSSALALLVKGHING